MNRFEEAIFIDNGAGNLTAIVGALHKICKEVMEEKKSTQAVWEDPAVRLIAHQIAHLTNVHYLRDHFLAYSQLVEQCEKRAEVGDEIR